MLRTENFSKYGVFYERDFDLAKHSYIGCGGIAPGVFYPSSAEELASLLKKLKQDGVAYYVLGNLSNVLPSDSGTEKVIIRLQKMNGIFCSEGVFAYAGAVSGAFLRACKAAGLSGGEFLYGIPCTIGGALYMNAGASGRYISEIVESVLVCRDGELRLLSLQECAYAYKDSAFMKNGDVIVGGSFRLKKASLAEIEREMQYYAQKRAHLPKGKSMGCTFKNPIGAYAGDLIERCGLKGFQIGGARISQTHANFIINENQGTAKDVRAIIETIKASVKEKFGVELQEEIRYLE